MSRSVLRLCAEVAGLWSHLEFECAATLHVVEHDVRLRVGLAVEQDTLHIDVLVAVVSGMNGENLSVAHVNSSLADHWRADAVLATSGFHLIESHG